MRFNSVSAALRPDCCIACAFSSNTPTSCVVCVIFSPIICICAEVFLEFSACCAELSTIIATVSFTCVIVPLVVSAAIPSTSDASDKCLAFSEISRITDCMASRSVIVTFESAPISSFLASSFSSTHTFKLPCASSSTTWMLLWILLLIDNAIFMANAIHTSIITITAITILPRILLMTASFCALSVPTKTMPIISLSEPF